MSESQLTSRRMVCGVTSKCVARSSTVTKPSRCTQSSSSCCRAFKVMRGSRVMASKSALYCLEVARIVRERAGRPAMLDHPSWPLGIAVRRYPCKLASERLAKGDCGSRGTLRATGSLRRITSWGEYEWPGMEPLSRDPNVYISACPDVYTERTDCMLRVLRTNSSGWQN